MKDQLLVIGSRGNVVDMTDRPEFENKKEMMKTIAEEVNVHIVTENHPDYKLIYETDLGFGAYTMKEGTYTNE